MIRVLSLGNSNQMQTDLRLIRCILSIFLTLSVGCASSTSETSEETYHGASFGSTQSIPLNLVEEETPNLTAKLQRSKAVSHLLSLNNPSSDLQIEAAVYRGSSKRGIITVEDSQTPSYHIRQPGEKRNHRNSLMLKVKVNQDAYLTIVAVDAEGRVRLLFPNRFSEKNMFYPNGRIKREDTVFLPDGLRSGNRAGFHWDYGPPEGTDTIRIFASHDRETTETIREFIRKIKQGAKETSGGGAVERGISTVQVGKEDALPLADSRKSQRQGRAVWTVVSLVVSVKN